MAAPHTEKTRNLAAHMLAKGSAITHVSEELNVSRRTIHEWLSKDVDFGSRLALARQLVRDGASDLVEARLSGMAARALEVLSAALDDPDMSPDLRVKVALAIVDRLRVPRMPEDGAKVDPRYAALEAAAGGADALRAQVGAALAESYGFGAPLELPAGVSQPPTDRRTLEAAEDDEEAP